MGLLDSSCGMGMPASLMCSLQELLARWDVLKESFGHSTF